MVEIMLVYMSAEAEVEEVVEEFTKDSPSASEDCSSSDCFNSRRAFSMLESKSKWN